MSASSYLKHTRDIDDTRERIAAYNAGALLADQLGEQYGSHGWSATRVAEKLHERITSSREQLVARIHRDQTELTANEYALLIARANAIGPDSTPAMTLPTEYAPGRTAEPHSRER